MLKILLSSIFGVARMWISFFLIEPSGPGILQKKKKKKSAILATPNILLALPYTLAQRNVPQSYIRFQQPQNNC